MSGAARSARRGAVLLSLALAAGAVQACWEEAGARYGVNPRLLYAIAKTESSLNPAAINRNKNGSYDVGLMQINSSWLPRLRKFGLDEQQLMEPCTSILVGAWILAQNMQRMGNSWDAVGAYNSSKPELRQKYALRVYRNLPPPVLAARGAP
ncbi:lytic transglycosylase domain-containing protein [Oxalobacteraceae bacterium]|nr:lytic transglycosylase domain-containing protein [Oxalobacteraceae bacterium]